MLHLKEDQWISKESEESKKSISEVIIRLENDKKILVATTLAIFFKGYKTYEEQDNYISHK